LKPEPGRILALDYGTKRVGLALSDESRTLASPLPALPATPFRALLDRLNQLAREKEVSLFLVGIPRNMDGSYGPSAQAARDFALRLREALLIPVREIDERLSTVQASRALRESGHDARKQKTRIDSAAAAVLLQAHLDAPPPIR
jgi:putative holliday junction resolvase